MESQIKALISYYSFTKKLKQNINSAEIIKSECYLIEENWMKKYKDFLLYGILKQEINNSLLNENYKVENIFEKYLNNYLIKIKDFEKQICKDIQNIEPSKEIDIFESGELNNIIKYNNLRLYIIDKETYKYMNRDPNKKIIFSQEKNYIINEGKIFISLSINSINKFEILICTLDSEKNHIIPELLYKYNLITLMQQDMDFLSQNDFTKFKNERISSNNNELINNNKNNNKEIQLKIFDLKSLNLLEQINKNVTINNKTQSISENDDEQNKTKKKTEINNNSRLSIQFEQEMNKDETKEILRNIQKKIKNIQKGTNYFNSSETRIVLNIIKQSQVILNDTRKDHIEFLLRFICFEEKLNAKINSSYKSNINKETGYIINISYIKFFFFTLKN